MVLWYIVGVGWLVATAPLLLFVESTIMMLMRSLGFSHTMTILLVLVGTRASQTATRIISITAASMLVAFILVSLIYNTSRPVRL